MRPTVFLALLGICGMAVTHGNGAEMCRNGSFPKQQAAFGLATVVGAPRTYLLSDTPPCPDESSDCRGHAYLLPGDNVITGASSGGYVCLFFPGPGGGSAGYVLRSQIASQKAAAPVPLAAWIGTWHNGDNSISLRRDGAKLTASGTAYWPSAHPSRIDAPGGPNDGTMDGTAVPQGNTATFADSGAGECRVTLNLLPPFLLAADNDSCGGMNVSFTGVYRKR